jgi:hypothetical protein
VALALASNAATPLDVDGEAVGSLGLDPGSYVFSAKVQLELTGDVDPPVVECTLMAGAIEVDVSAVRLGPAGIETIPLAGAATLDTAGDLVLTCGGTSDALARRVRLTATQVDNLTIVQ